MDDIRHIISLDGEWDFAYTNDEPEENNVVFPGVEQYDVKMPVPAYWDDNWDRLKYADFWSRKAEFNPAYRKIEFPMGSRRPPDASLQYLIGTGWYRKSFYADENWGNKTAVLTVGGVTMEAWVWLNGHYIGRHIGYGTPFEMELDNAVKYGEENELIIAVSNKRKDRIGCSIRGFKGKSAGITRSVSIRVSETARIDDCYVRTDIDMNTLFWEVLIEKKIKADATIEWSIGDCDTNNIIAEGTLVSDSNVVKWKTGIFNMEMWSDNDPKLYNINLTIIVDGKKCDKITQLFGLRFAAIDNQDIRINGVTKFLRGLTEHAYFPETCTVPTDFTYYLRTIKALKSMGFNWMRFHTTIPPEECMEAADRLGMFIQVETPNGFSEQDFLDMLYACRKHPSVILYCCGNEVPLDTIYEKIEKMAKHCHAIIPDALFNPMEALLNVECRLDENDPDYKTEPFPYNCRKLGKMREYSDVFAPGVGVLSYHSLNTDIEWLNNRLGVYGRPCLVHEAGIFDSYINLDLERRYDGTRIGPDLFSAVRRYMCEEGVLDNATIYYQNSCKWMRQIIKFALEKARRCDNMAGYDFLGAIDCHWHRTGYAVGMLNEFYEPKFGFNPDDVRRFNGENIIISDIEHKRSYHAGETVKVELYASIFGETAMDKGLLTYALEDDEKRVYSHGIRSIGSIPNGAITDIGQISFTMPEIRGIGKHLSLKVELLSESVRIENVWDFWTFSGNKVQADVRVTENLSQEDIQFMNEGGKLLLIGQGPFPALPITFQITPGGRVNGNSASVIYDHPITRNFPHDGFCDWQFEPMFRGGGAVLFNELDIPFEPIIEIVGTYKMIRKQAAVFELGVGKGGMVVCTLNLSRDDAASKEMYNSILKYISSDNFLPKTTVSAEWLSELCKENKDVFVDFSTDEGYDIYGHIEV